MTRELETNVNVEVDARYDDLRDDGSAVEDHLDFDLGDESAPVKLFDGVGDTSANRLWHELVDLSVTNGHVQTLDLAGGITDSFGNTVTLSSLKGLLIHNRASTTGADVSIGGATSAFSSWLGSATDKVMAGPEGTVFVYSPKDGYPVTATTGDELKLSTAGSDAEVEVIVFGDE